LVCVLFYKHVTPIALEWLKSKSVRGLARSQNWFFLDALKQREAFWIAVGLYRF
jgi:hypothetical protein